MTDGPGGVRIVSDRLGDPSARAVVFLHGGGQTRRSWARAAAAVAERGWQAITVDFRGHGESDWSAEGDYRVVSFADDVRRYCANFRRTRSWWAHPLAASPRCSSRASSRRASRAPWCWWTSCRIWTRPGRRGSTTSWRTAWIEGFESLDEVADMIAEYNPHRPRPTDLDGLRANLRRRGDRWYWHWDPKFIDGTAFPPDRGDRHGAHARRRRRDPRDGVPMLLVRGQVSDLVSEERADEFLARFPQVEFVDVHGAGHMVAGDRNDLFAEAVVDFLNRHANAL